MTFADTQGLKTSTSLHHSLSNSQEMTPPKLKHKRGEAGGAGGQRRDPSGGA